MSAKGRLAKKIIEERESKALALQEIFLSKEELEGLGHEELGLYVQVSQGQNLLGTAKITNLKEVLQRNVNLYDTLFVKLFNHDSWQSLKTHPLFQRRKLEVLNTAKNQEELNLEALLSFYILKNGEKKGPFIVDDIRAKLASQELLATDLIALAKEEETKWKKIYTFQEFDRRGHLPSLPSKNIQFQKQGLGLHSLSENSEDEKKMALSHLVQSQKEKIKNLKESHLKDANPEVKNNDFLQKKEKSFASFLQSKILPCLGIMLVILGSYFFFQKKNENTLSEEKKRNAPLAVQKDKESSDSLSQNFVTPFMPKKKKAFFGEMDNSRRKSIFESPTPMHLQRKERAPSFTSSMAFKNRNDEALDKMINDLYKPQEDVSAGTLSYDNEESVIYEGLDKNSLEFDEIRDQLSQTIYEEDYLDEEYGGYYDSMPNAGFDDFAHEGLVPVETLDLKSYILPSFEWAEPSDVEMHY